MNSPLLEFLGIDGHLALTRQGTVTFWLRLSHTESNHELSHRLQISKSNKCQNNSNLTFQSPPKTAVKSIDPPVLQNQHPNVRLPRFRGVNSVAQHLTVYSVAIKMKHLAAYLLLTIGGNSSPSAKDVKNVLESVGIEADDERLSTLISELKGKDINEVRIYTLQKKWIGG